MEKNRSGVRFGIKEPDNGKYLRLLLLFMNLF
jgi:hypothetical protein